LKLLFLVSLLINGFQFFQFLYVLFSATPTHIQQPILNKKVQDEDDIIENNYNNKKKKESIQKLQPSITSESYEEQRREAVEYILPKLRNSLEHLESTEFIIHDCKYLLDHCYLHQSSREDRNFEQLVMVSAVSSAFVPIIEHLVGSIQYWEPNLKMVFYYLSQNEQYANKDEIEQMKSYCNVEVRIFDASQYPPHFSDFGNFAWKPVIIRKTAEEFGSILWMDSSMELRGKLYEIKEHINFDGYFVTTSHPDMYSWTHSDMFKWFNISKYIGNDINPILKNKNYMMIQASVQGWRFGTVSYKKVVPLVEKCAMDPNCISPKDASKTNHRYDQSAYTIALFLAHLPATADHRFNAWSVSDPYLNDHNPFDPNQILQLFTRRGGAGPYNSKALRCIENNK